MSPQPALGDFVQIIWEIQLLRYNGVGALSMLIWDMIITFSDEVHYIWPQSRRSPTKWVFLLTRYFGLLAQARLVSICLTVIDGQFSIEECRMIYTTQVVCGGILLACIQAILMLRVYALYSQDRRVAIAMITLLIAEIGSMPGAIRLTMPTSTGNMCMKPITVRDIALFGVSAILPQLLVLGLTIIKFFSGLRDGWGAIPIVSRLVRDDIILVAVIVVWVVISAALTSINRMYGYIGYSWLLSLIPSLGCRVVISMQKLADSSGQSPTPGRRSGSSPQLTTCLFVESDSISNASHHIGSTSVSQVSMQRPSPTNSQLSTSITMKAVIIRDGRKLSDAYSTTNFSDPPSNSHMLPEALTCQSPHSQLQPKLHFTMH